MKSGVVDSSTIISFSGSCLMSVFPKLKQKFGIKFMIPQAVLRESVTKPSTIKRFELNAARINYAIEKKYLELQKMDPETVNYLNQISKLANSIFYTKKRKISILHDGEAQALALLKQCDSKLLIMDERTTRMLIEDPVHLNGLLSRRLHTEVSYDKDVLHELLGLLPEVEVVRSSELTILASEYNMLPEELGRGKEGLRSALYSLKFGGLAISIREIDEFISDLK